MPPLNAGGNITLSAHSNVDVNATGSETGNTNNTGHTSGTAADGLDFISLVWPLGCDDGGDGTSTHTAAAVDREGDVAQAEYDFVVPGRWFDMRNEALKTTTNEHVLRQHMEYAHSFVHTMDAISNLPADFLPHDTRRCKTLLIERTGYVIELVGLKGGKCTKCGLAIPGVWS